MNTSLKVREQFSPNQSSISSINKMREIVHLQAGQCGNQIGSKVGGGNI